MADPKNDLEAFAALCAALVDPLIPRRQTLESAGLADESALVALHAAWAPKLGGAELRERFREAYAAARARPRTQEGGEGAKAVALLPTDAAPPLKTAGPPREVPVSLGAELDATGEVMPRVLPAIPFVEVERDSFGIPVSVAAAVSRGGLKREDSGTVALPPDSAATGPATPFEKRPPAADDANDDIDLDSTTEFRPAKKDT